MADGADIGHADELVRKLRLIPDGWRRFAVSAARATAEYRILPDVLSHVADAGLTRVGRAGEPLFDHYDLVNLALDLRLMSPWTFGMRWWGRTLESRNTLDVCQVRYAFTCPDRNHEGDCRVEVLTPDRGWVAQCVTPPATS